MQIMIYKLKEFMNSKIYVISTICTSKTQWAQESSYLRIYEGKNLYTQESTINQQQESTRIYRFKVCVDLRIQIKEKKNLRIQKFANTIICKSKDLLILRINVSFAI